MAVVHCVTRLRQRAEQVVSNEHHTKYQHALVKPAGHTPAQGRGSRLVNHGLSSLAPVYGPALSQSWKPLIRPAKQADRGRRAENLF